MELSRRSFIATAGAAAAAAGAAATIQAAQAAQTGSSADSSSADSASGSSKTGSADSSSTAGSTAVQDWRTPPAEVTDFSQEIDCDAVVCGHGFAGICACRELAEQGKKVYLIEKRDEDGFAPIGNEFASLNSDILKERGVEEIDPVEFYQNFMKITSNQPNPELVMKFAQNSAEATNWYLSALTADDFATMTTAFFPKTAHQLDMLSGIKFWPSVCSFYGECNQTKIHDYNRDLAKEAGATFMFSTEAWYVIMESGAVTGLVAKAADGSFIRFNCKAVVCACGGFGGNKQMMQDFMPDMANACVEGEELSCMMGINDGRGVQMAYWAGAHLETTPVAGMNMKGLSVPGKMNVLPQAIWIDENGKRYCNEYYPVSEQRGYQGIFSTRKTKFAVMDDNFTEYRQYTLPQHAGFTASEENLAALRGSMDKGYAVFKGEATADDSTEAAGPGPMTQATYLADDTLEGLASQLGLEGSAKEAFLQQIQDWNSYCESGVDLQFGRDPQVLFPVEKAPFYAVEFEPELGETMVTMGGILTDGKQRAIDKNYEPIPGLYVSGNDCGRRFGYEYVTPIPGVSIGFAVTLGRECGKEVAAFLDE